MPGSGGLTAAKGGYRPEIDGLRAIAVLAVILDHAGMPWLPGGFIGVDIFFVISGYLITRIIVDQLAEGRFSLAHFYERRARRILPALLLMLLLTVPAAILLMMPADLDDYGQSLAATTVFANNVRLAGTTSYFAVAADMKPLLHSWSLGVEEQYYLLAPVLLLLAWRTAKLRAVWIGIAVASVISALLSHWLAPHRDDVHFFLITSRVWELGAGALAVLSEARLRQAVKAPARAVLALAGLAMVVAALLLFRWQMKLPDWPSALPVLGACLLLVFAETGGPVTRLLSLPPLVWTGLISYSLYLFHQPIFAFARLASLEEPSPWLIPALIVPVFTCAWASWRFVEQPFRDPARVSTRALLITVSAGSIVALAVGLGLYFSHGLRSSWPELADPNSGYDRRINVAYNNAPRNLLGAPLPEKPGHGVLVIGASFARDFINMARETHRLDGYAISYADEKECKARPGPDTLRNASRADAIVLASRLTPGMIPCVARLAARLRAVSKAPILILGSKSFGMANAAPMTLMPPAQRYGFRPKPLRDEIVTNDLAKRAFAGERYVDMLGMLMDADGRVPLFTPDRKLISWDRYHLTRPGARYVGEIIFRDPAFAVLPSLAK